MTAIEIVGNLYIRNQIIEEQIQVLSQEKGALEQMVTAFKSKEYAQRLANRILDPNFILGGIDLGEDEVKITEMIEKSLNDPKLLIPDAPEVTEAEVIAARDAAAVAAAGVQPEADLPQVAAVETGA